jgi:hypothetical protein
MHVGTLCWKPGGCSSDQTIVRPNVDTGVAWCFIFAVAMDIYIISRVSSTKYYVFRSPSLLEHRYNTIIHFNVYLVQ